MTRVRQLYLSALLVSLLPSVASAEPTTKQWAKSRVEVGLMKPLVDKENKRSLFSRVVQPPRQRRVRVLTSSVSRDRRGSVFIPFGIEVRYQKKEWEADIIGCVYRSTGKIYVKVGDQYRPAEFLLGKKVKPVAGACQPKG